MTQKSYAEILKLALLVVVVAIVPVLIWYLFGVILMAFGAVILAMLLRLGAQPFVRWLKLPQPVALIISGLLILFVLGGVGYLFGKHISDEFSDVVQRAGSASDSIKSSLQGSQFGNFILKRLSSTNVSVATLASGFLRISSNFLEALLIMVISGIYFASQPHLYRRGLIWLFPPDRHGRVAEIIDGIGEGLRLWLLGQLIQMIVIGALVTGAVWIIGVPSPLALGLIAGVAEFIPYLGPILAGIPAVLVALTKSPQLALWALLVYVIIHQIEGQIIAPLVQRRMVSIPPAVMLLGIAALTYLFGTVAIIFAAPIAVVVFIAVNLIYVRDTLGEKTELIRKLR